MSPPSSDNFWLRYFKSITRVFGANVKSHDENDIIIAVIGPSGSGKSSFINAVTGGGQAVGHSQESCTAQIEPVRLAHPEWSSLNLVFVDTPGFDEPKTAERDILIMVAHWLQKTYKKNVKLSGILYFHRIADNRNTFRPPRNFDKFRQLCGDEAPQKIVFTTSMWDKVEHGIGEQREDELRQNFWTNMIKQGAKTARFDNSPESARSIVFEAAKEHFQRVIQPHGEVAGASLQKQGAIERPQREMVERMGTREVEQDMDLRLKDCSPTIPPVSQFRINFSGMAFTPSLEKYGEPPCHDLNEQPLYIGSARFREGLHPCKIGVHLIPSCKVSYDGGEHDHYGQYDLLPFRPQHMEWVPASYGQIPPGRLPVEGGYEKNGEKLYHALGLVGGLKVPGKTGEHLVRGHNMQFLLKEHNNDLDVSFT